MSTTQLKRGRAKLPEGQKKINLPVTCNFSISKEDKLKVLGAEYLALKQETIRFYQEGVKKLIAKK